jgi:hypothetical protein
LPTYSKQGIVFLGRKAAVYSSTVVTPVDALECSV